MELQKRKKALSRGAMQLTIAKSEEGIQRKLINKYLENQEF